MLLVFIQFPNNRNAILIKISFIIRIKKKVLNILREKN